MENQPPEKEVIKVLVKITRYTILVPLLLVVGILLFVGLMFSGRGGPSAAETNAGTNGSIISASTQITSTKSANTIPADAWKVPDAATIPAGKMAI